jgi:small-conductance mechanosensitive channel
MEDFIPRYDDELLKTAITIVVLLIIRFALSKGISKVGKKSDMNRARTLLIIKYVNVSILALAALAGSLIWGVNFKELGLIFSSVFAVIGVALFAQWSILSNVTAGVILFFSFPFKIGDRIRIQDKDFPAEAVIEDIRAFHIHLRTDEGELLTYPNNLLLQKGVVVMSLKNPHDHSEHHQV